VASLLQSWMGCGPDTRGVKEEMFQTQVPASVKPEGKAPKFLFRNVLVAISRDSILERRARRIPDPIERLRYLRAAAVRPASRPLPWLRPLFVAALALFFVCLSPPLASVSHANPSLLRLGRVDPPPFPPPGDFAQIWAVEEAADHEAFSNGLRVDNSYEAGSEPRRSYVAFAASDPRPESAVTLTAPAGLVFHTTESDELPFLPDENQTLQRVSAELLRFVQRHRSYHFVIDRFGRVYRVVPEDQIAYHAGDSAWGDNRYLYLDLNRSFLGIAFETRTRPGQPVPNLTSAQTAAARALTEMLRSRYRIPVADCVTHAQVSLNRGYHLLGWHTDFAASFPFQAVGLPDNYSLPPAAIYALGFHYDGNYLRLTGPRLLPGLASADRQIANQSARLGLPENSYRNLLWRRYKELLAARRRAAGG
jgi:hypothetical protein